MNYKGTTLEDDIYEYWLSTQCSYEQLRRKFTPNIYTVDHIRKMIKRKFDARNNRQKAA